MGPFPPDLLPILLEAGLIACVELPKLRRREADIEAAMEKESSAALDIELRRLERKRQRLRLALRDFERTLEEAGRNRTVRPVTGPPTMAELLDGMTR